MRARNIKPGFFTNEVLSVCTPCARLLFAGLWCLADREGRLEDRPKRISAELFPYQSEVDIESLLTELCNAGFVIRYESQGVKCIEVAKFTTHQRPHSNEAASVLPPREKATFDQGRKPRRTTVKSDSGNGAPTLRSDTGYRIPDTGLSDSLIPEGASLPVGLVFPPSFDCGQVKNTLAVFLDYRRNIGKPLKEASVQALVTKWARTSPQVFTDAVETTISNGWQGLFEPKNGASNAKRTGPGQRYDETAAARDPDHGKF